MPIVAALPWVASPELRAEIEEMNHLKLCGMALVTLLSALLVGCNKDSSKTASPSSGGGSSGKPKLGFVVKQPEEPWFQLEWKFADEAAKKYDFDLVKIGAADGDKVLAAIDNLRSQNAGGLVICTPDVTLRPAIVNQANQHNLKLLAVDDG